MSLADIVGTMDVPSAFVAVGVGAGMTIVTVTAMLRPTRRSIEAQFQLEKLRIEMSNVMDERNRKVDLEKYVSQLGLQRDIEFKRIESGLVDLKVAGQS